MNWLPDARFGAAESEPIDWRADADEATEIDIDDEELDKTPPDVVMMLGFDPKAALASDEGEFEEAKHPRDAGGKFGSGGGKGGGATKPEKEGGSSTKQKLTMPQYGLTPSPSSAAHQSPTGSSWQPASRPPMPQSSGAPDEADSTVVFEPGADLPAKELNGVAFEPWNAPDEWADVEGQADVDEPPLPELPKGMTLSSGVIIREPDGRVWMTRPAGGFGGYHHCVTLDSLILTRRGWLRYDEVHIGDETLGFDRGELRWTPVLEIVKFSDAEIVRYGGKQWSVLCTPNHRWVKESPHGNWGMIEAKDCLPKSTKRHSLLLAAPIARDCASNGISAHDAAVISWLVTDGCVYRNNKSQFLAGKITQQKARGIAALDELLRFVKHTKSRCQYDGKAYFVYYLKSEYTRALFERTGWKGTKAEIPLMVTNLSRDATEAFFWAAWEAEGYTTVNRGCRIALFQKDGPVFDAMVIAAFKLGYLPLMSGRPNEMRRISACSPRIKDRGVRCNPAGRADVWCVRTALGTWTIKQGKSVVLTGNTFPKGGVEDGLSPQANAIKEAWEETGLQVRITGFSGDHEGDTTISRFYTAERVGGDPADAGWESEAVVLAPPGKLKDFLNRSRDRDIADSLIVADQAFDDATWEEGKHPRAPDGKFGSGGASAKSKPSAPSKVSAAITKTIKHLAAKGHDLVANPSMVWPTLSDEEKEHLNETFGSGKMALHAISNEAKKIAAAPKAPNPIAPGIMQLGDFKKMPGTKMGSNPGAIYESKSDPDQQFYIKESKSLDHTKNEMIAARLFALSGSPTLTYHHVAGGKHVATELLDLENKNVSDLSPAERKQAQSDFVTNAWLANWDAAGTGGDNIGSYGGKAIPLDFGGALAYRAQGEPKGDAFGDHVNETASMKDPQVSPDNAKLYGDMTAGEVKASAQRVVNIPDDEIVDAIADMGGSEELAEKMIERKNDIAKQFNLEFEGQHARGPGGKFQKMYGAEEPGETVASTPAETPPPAAPQGIPGGTLKSFYPSKSQGEHIKKVHMVLNNPADAGTKFRWIVGSLIKEAETMFETSAASANATNMLKAKIGESFALAGQEAAQAGDAKGAQKALNKAKEFGWTEGAPKAQPAAKAAPAAAAAPPKAAPKPVTPQLPPAAAAPPKKAEPAKPAFPAPTEQELGKAKKNVALKVQYVPGAPDTPAAQKLVDKFNEKYAGKDLADNQAALIQKVNDFKQLQADMIPLMSVEQKAQAEQQQKATEKAAAAAAAVAQAEANKTAAENLKKSQEAEKVKNKEYMAALGITEAEAHGFNALVKMHGGDSQDLIAKFRSYEQQAEKLGYPISGFQYALIRNYINGGYNAINEALRSNSLTQDQHVYTKMVNAALDKMPKYTGMLERGTSLPAEVLAKYQPGKVVVEHGFTSTGAGYSFGGNVKYKIKSNGMRAADFSKGANVSEKEVLFKAHTPFLVHKVETRGGTTYIEMEEIEYHG